MAASEDRFVWECSDEEEALGVAALFQERGIVCETVEEGGGTLIVAMGEHAALARALSRGLLEQCIEGQDRAERRQLEHVAGRGRMGLWLVGAGWALAVLLWCIRACLAN